MTPLSSPHNGQNCHFLSGALFWGVSAGKLAQGYVTLDSKLRNTWDCVDQLGDIQGKSEWTSNWKTQFVVAYLHVSAEWDMKSMWDKTYPILVAKEEDKKCLFFFFNPKEVSLVFRALWAASTLNSYYIWMAGNLSSTQTEWGRRKHTAFPVPLTISPGKEQEITNSNHCMRSSSFHVRN